MKRLTLLLAVALLAWAATSDAKTFLLYSKTDSIWARIGYTTVAGNPTGLGLSEATIYRHYVDSTGVLRNAGNCTSFWAEVVQVRGPDAVADSASIFVMSMRSHNPFTPDNDTLTVTLGARRAHLALQTAPGASPLLDTASVVRSGVVPTDSTLGWGEYGARITPATTANTLWQSGAMQGQRIDFLNTYNGQPLVAYFPSFRWRVIGTALNKWPKLVWYKLTIYCKRED